jgi:ribonuclease HI
MMISQFIDLAIAKQNCMQENIKEVIIYTDGACTGNPGPGGYGVVLLADRHRKELSGGYRLTTNNRMEMMAAIVALQALKYRCLVTLHTDSKYLVDALAQGWAKKWQKNGWMRNKKESAKNPDLWQQLLDLCNKHEVKFVWVRGHAGIAENECCDRLAVKAAHQLDLPPDLGYENCF